MSAVLYGLKTTEEQVRAVVTPPATRTHFPMPHDQFIDQGCMGAERAGLKITDKQFSLADCGNQLFCVMTCKSESTELELAVGLSHSHNKTLSARFGCGTVVFVCSNLCFSATEIITHKHTLNMRRNLPDRIDDMYLKLPELVKNQDEQIERFKQTELTDLMAEHIVVSAVRKKGNKPFIFPSTKLNAVLDLWDAPDHEIFRGRNCWSLLNAFTQVNNTRSVSSQFQSSGLFQLFTDQLDALSL